MKKIILSSILAASFCSPLFAKPKGDNERQPPNIVFILIDDMGWKDITPNGSEYYETPNIAKMAEEGMNFPNAYSASAVCSPARAAIISGKAPARLNITDWIGGESAPKNARYKLPKWTKRLAPEGKSLPDVLRSKGYTSAAIGKWHLGHDSLPIEHGFNVSIAGRGMIGRPVDYFWPYGKLDHHLHIPDIAQKTNPAAEEEYLTDRLTDEAVRFIANAKDEPFFLYLAHYAVHTPLMAKDEDEKLFVDKTPDGQQNNPTYAGMVKSVDDSVGRIFKAVREAGIDDNTLIVFTSDNGGGVTFDGTDCAPLRGGKGFPYEGGPRVPLVVWGPGLGVKANAVNNSQVIGMDFLPTFSHLAGVPEEDLPEILDGVDISSSFGGEEIPSRPLVWHYPHYWSGGIISPYSTLRDGDWKLVRWYEYETDELYNLADDPSENHDLSKEKPQVLKRMVKQMESQLDAWDAQLPINHYPTRPASNPKDNRGAGDKFRRGL